MPTGFIGNQNAVRSYSEYFSGNDVTLNFQMSQFGYNMNGAVSVRVYINGVSQQPNSFAIQGKTLSFFTAPPTGTSNIEVVHLIPYINELNPLQKFEFVTSMSSLNVVTFSSTTDVSATSNTSSLNATAAYIQSLDAVNFRGSILASNYSTMNAAIAAATTNANTLVVTSNVVLQATSTIPDTVHVVFTSNGRVTLQTGTNLWIRGPLTAPPTQIFTGSGTANGFNEVSEAYVEWWGAARNGSTDDTLPFEAAMVSCANSCTIKLLSGIYVLNVANFVVSNTVLRMSGQGESSVVMLPNTGAFNSSLFSFSGTNIIAKFDNMAFDQQSQIQLSTSDNQGIIFQAKGTLTNASGLIVESCTFKNGCFADIRVSGGDSVQNTTTFVMIRGNRFLGGQEGTTTTHDPRAVDISTPCDFVIEGNYGDLLRDRVAYGRAGIVTYDGWGILANTTPNFTPKGVITGNYFKRFGRSETSSTLGVIDSYNFGIDILIADNIILDCYGRGIQTKADARRMVITNNLVDGLANGIGGLLAINSSPDYTAGGTILIQGNVLANNPYGGGLICTGAGVEEGSGVTFQSRATSCSIIDNIIKDVAGDAIDQSYHRDVVIHNNTVSNAAFGIASQNTFNSLTIRNNNISNTTLDGIFTDAAAQNCLISVTQNQVRDVFGASNEGIYIGSGRRVLAAENTIQNVGGNGLVVTLVRDSLSILGNQIERTGIHGISSSECAVMMIDENIVSNTANIGIYATGGVYASVAICSTKGNRIQHTFDEGLRTDNFQTIHDVGNIVSNCGTLSASSGIYGQAIGQMAMFVGNQVRQVGSAGISVGSANVGTRITYQGNQMDNTVGYGILTNSANVIVAIHGNQVANVSGVSRGIYLAANVAGQIVGNWVDPLTVTTPLFEVAADGYHSVGLNSWNPTQHYASAAPTTGIWRKNDIVWNTNVAAAGNVGFVCTVAGSPGTWKNFGPIGA